MHTQNKKSMQPNDLYPSELYLKFNSKMAPCSVTDGRFWTSESDCNVG